jgi:hypothetical protein
MNIGHVITARYAMASCPASSIARSLTPAAEWSVEGAEATFMSAQYYIRARRP